LRNALGLGLLLAQLCTLFLAFPAVRRHAVSGLTHVFKPRCSSGETCGVGASIFMVSTGASPAGGVSEKLTTPFSSTVRYTVAAWPGRQYSIISNADSPGSVALFLHFILVIIGRKSKNPSGKQ